MGESQSGAGGIIDPDEAKQEFLRSLSIPDREEIDESLGPRNQIHEITHRLLRIIEGIEGLSQSGE